MSCGGCPRHIPLAGENGPSFQGGSGAPPSAGGFAWDRTPIATLLVVLFLAVIVFKVLR